MKNIPHLIRPLIALIVSALFAPGVCAQPAASHFTAANYAAGSTLTITNSFTYSGTLWSLLFRPHLPAGWTLVPGTVSGDGTPEYQFGEVVWMGALPSSPVRLVYSVQVPASASGSQQLRDEFEYLLSGTTETAAVYASPDPLTLSPATNTEPHNTVTLLNGTVAGQTVAPGQYAITVAPGATIQGSFSVRIHNAMPSSAIAPLAATPTWGTPSTSYWEVDPWLPSGDSTRTVQVNLTAPSTPGTYYVAVAMGGTYNSAQLMSGTHPGYPADWVNGNKVALLPASNFETAAANGWIPFNWYTPTGPAAAELAVTAIKVTVEQLNRNTVTLLNGTVAGQTVGAGQRAITVAPGATIQGSFSVRIHNAMPGSAIAPLAATPTWGAPSTSYWEIDPWLPSGDSTRTVQVNLTAPTTPGIYYVAVAMGGTYNSAQIMSGTHAAYPADWVNGNKVALLPASNFETAAANGWIPFNWYTPAGPAAAELAITALRVVVAGPGVTLQKAVKPAFYGLTAGTRYQLQTSQNAQTWANHGEPFTATSANMAYPQYWDVDGWNKLYFRLQSLP